MKLRSNCHNGLIVIIRHVDRVADSICKFHLKSINKNNIRSAFYYRDRRVFVLVSEREQW